MSNVNVNVHVHGSTHLDVQTRATENGRHVAVRIGKADIYIHDREKALEIASKVEQAAQKWGAFVKDE